MEKKVFNIGVELDADFVDEIERLKEKFGTKMTELNGFADYQMNYTGFIDNFIDKNTADASIDGNANVHGKDIVVLENEMAKPHMKLLSFNKLFYEMKKKWGLKAAQDWLEKEWDGHLYLHDAFNSTFCGYCWAGDVDRVAREGLFFFDNGSHAPQHLTTFTDFLCETVSYAENRSAGAFGMPSALVWMFYFWRKDCKEGYFIKDADYYRDQEFQRFIYKLNQPYLRSGIQSAFTNISIFDRPYFESLFGGLEFPDGTFAIDFEEEFIEFQKAFMEEVSRIRKDCMMTFPVLTYSLLRVDGKFVDDEFARWACAHNQLWGDSNFYVSDSVDSLSSCCFSANTEVLWRSSEVGVNRTTFKNLFDTTPAQRHNFKIFHNGSWVKGSTIRLPAAGHKVYKVTLANKKEMVATDNHLFPTLYGDIRTDALTTDDYIMVNTRALNGVDSCVGYGYEEGYLLGMYLGDGSQSGETGIILSITEKKYERTFDKVCRAVKSIDDDATVNLRSGEHNVWYVYVGSHKVHDFIFDYVSGYHAQEKTISMDCLIESTEFRRGIIDGMYATDGGNSNRIYTSSPELAKDLETILTSLGRQSIVDCSDRTNEPVVIRGVTWKRNFPLWCVRFYSETNKRNFVNVYKTINNCTYFNVTSVEEIPYDDEYVYCFEMENKEEPYFTLPNGVITHNCRMRNAVSGNDSVYFNSIGGSGLNVGSVKVNTVNLARCAYESGGDVKTFLDNVYDVSYRALQLLDVQRHVIQRNVEKGLLPNYSSGLVDMSKQYSTLGIASGSEAIQFFGLCETDQFGYFRYTSDGLSLYEQVLAEMHRAIDNFRSAQNVDYQINMEQIPGERAAAVLMQKDKLLYPNGVYDLPLYGNQWIPLAKKATIQDRTITCGLLDKACNGGSIEHIGCEAPITDFDTAWELLNWVADQGVNYFAFCYRISTCKNNHSFYGDVCPICGEPVDTTWQRVVGFLTPVKSYSKERNAEFKLRDWMDLNRMEDLQ